MNDTLIFLVLAGIALIFKWLSSRGSGEAEKPEPPAPNDVPRRSPPQSEEERVRRFLEALGAPPGSQPPAPVRPRPLPPGRVVTPARPTRSPKAKRSWTRPLPPLVTTPEDAPMPPLTTTAEIPQVVLPVAPLPPPASGIAQRPVVRPDRAVSAASPTRISLGELLRARDSVRQAIILREVLGPPRGLRALDLDRF